MFKSWQIPLLFPSKFMFESLKIIRLIYDRKASYCKGVFRTQWTSLMECFCENGEQLRAWATFLQSNFIEIPLRHGCSPVNFLHIFRTTFHKNTSGRLSCMFSPGQSCNQKPFKHLKRKIHCKIFVSEYFMKY